MPSRRDVAFFGSIAVVVVGAVVIWFGGAAVVAAVLGAHAPDAPIWLAVAKAVSLAWVAAIGWTVSWRRLDEMARETRKTVWFVGSTAAILATAPIMLVCLLGGGGFLTPIAIGHGAPGGYCAMGWIALLIAQLFCSLIARAGWWFTKR